MLEILRKRLPQLSFLEHFPCYDWFCLLFLCYFSFPYQMPNTIKSVLGDIWLCKPYIYLIENCINTAEHPAWGSHGPKGNINLLELDVRPSSPHVLCFQETICVPLSQTSLQNWMVLKLNGTVSYVGLLTSSAESFSLLASLFLFLILRVSTISVLDKSLLSSPFPNQRGIPWASHTKQH